jgi:hypothetical protein
MMSEGFEEVLVDLGCVRVKSAARSSPKKRPVGFISILLIPSA